MSKQCMSKCFDILFHLPMRLIFQKKIDVQQQKLYPIAISSIYGRSYLFINT